MQFSSSQYTFLTQAVEAHVWCPCFYAWCLLQLHQYKSITEEAILVSERSESDSINVQKASRQCHTNLGTNHSTPPWPGGPRIAFHSTVSLKRVMISSVVLHLLTVRPFTHLQSILSNFWFSKSKHKNVINSCIIN